MTSRNTSAQRQQLLAQAWALVPPIAQRYAKASPEPLDDLLQVGLLGLLTAANRYDASAEVPFDCFARPHIRGAILHHLRDRAWLVRLPRRQAERQHRLAQQHDAGLTGEDLEALRRWAAMVRPTSLEDLQGGGVASLASIHGLDEASDTQDQLTYRPAGLHPSWENGTTRQMLAQLQPRQRTVLQCVVLEGWSYRKTAAKLNVSAATVQRLLHQGLNQLRSTLQQTRISHQPGRRAASAAQGC